MNDIDIDRDFDGWFKEIDTFFDDLFKKKGEDKGADRYRQDHCQGQNQERLR